MSSRTTPTVAVLMGGPSAEREVSLDTGRACAAALREYGYEMWSRSMLAPIFVLF